MSETTKKSAAQPQASFPIPFALGETLWWTGYGGHEETITCPECVGTKAVTLTLGNGETYSLACACCGTGWENPRGYLKRNVREYKPTPFIARRVDISSGNIRYRQEDPSATCYRPVDVEDLFRDREACEARCAEKMVGFLSQEEIDIKNRRSRSRKDLTWSVHYWSRMAKDLERELESVRNRLNVCKERKKAKEAQA